MDRRLLFERAASELSKHGVRRAKVFGSYARGDMREESDIDILVEFSSRKSLLEIVRIERELSDSLGVKVDLLTEQSISPYLIEQVKEEARTILDEEGR